MGMSWRAIIAALGTAADLVRSARNLHETVSDLRDRREPSSPPPEPGTPAALAEIYARMEGLEATQGKQAEILAKMADQDQVLWNQLRQLAARVDKVFWIALAALILSSLLVLREIIRLIF